MKTSATNRKIRILITAIKDEALIPRPEFQRRLVWTNKHKQEFISTILLEYPFPEIYIASGDVNPDTGEGTELLVDGQQRITTIYQYFTGSPDLRLGGVRPYVSLTTQEKLGFLEYEVVVRDLGKKSIEEIREVFKRINSTKYSLNAMEIHNARYDGAFKQFGETLTQHSFFESHDVFGTQDVKRMGDVLFCLTLVATLMSTYFHRDDELEDYLHQYNDEFPRESEIAGDLDRVFTFITKCEFPLKSRVWKKADLFTLIVEVYRAMIRNKFALIPAHLSVIMQDFYDHVDLFGRDSDGSAAVGQYYKASIQATNDRSSRLIRGEIVEKVIRNEISWKP